MIEDLEEQAMRDPSDENMSDLMLSSGWFCRVISRTPVIASKIWTSLEMHAINLPFGENAAKFAILDT
jgi:hypothetical protein